MKKKTTLVVASHNPGKLREIREILAGQDVEVILQSDLGLDIDVEETGTTFEENARLKAQAVMDASGLPTVADDSGIEVDALDGGPGVYSARFGGTRDDEAHNRLLLKKLAGVPDPERTARYVCAVVCLFPDGRAYTGKGTCEGWIGHEEIGTGGFGYDPLFCLPGGTVTMAQLTEEEKNKISHRGRALRAMAEQMEREENSREESQC